ncbi:MAG: CBS domain-containing protein [Patescibacteria group bacterium]|nr:CBS domain-containing protein [Patescibacteria group bacterium]
MTTLLSLLCILIAISLAVARKVYDATPAKEIKRQAARNKQPASQLFEAVAYGSSLRALLWGGVAIFGAVGLVLLARSVRVVVSVPIMIAALSFLFIWLPASRVTKLGMRLTLLLNPVIVWLLRHLYPLLSRGAERLEKHYPIAHTGLFERSDVVQLIQQQADQQDSRLSIEELAIIQRALAFGDYLVRDITTPRAEIMTVAETEILGPILIDELHKSTAPFILVTNSDGATIGSLETQKLGLKSSGPVSDHLSPVYFLHESDTLREALHAFFVTNYPLFVVVNSFEEYVGIVTIESVLRQLLGHLPGDEFEQYSDLQAVAARHPRPESTKNRK